jgi:hypothetical protein
LSNGNDDDIEVIGGVDPRLMAAAREDADDRSITDLVEQPAKVMRIGTMIKQLLEEVRAAPLDDAELRIAQAQLVGWLEGLFHGIQTALFAQQMAARSQLEQMRQGALPPGISRPGGTGSATGQYL